MTITDGEIVFGWSAPPLREQFPNLNVEDADHFDLDSKAISRLSVRGLITRAERDSAVQRLSKSISTAVGRASK